MKLEDLLAEEMNTITKAWFQLVLETYPPDASQFLKREENSFANPVGTTISDELGNIFAELLNGVNPRNISPFLDRIIRIRAVQDFSPSRAIGFVFDLKKVIRSELENTIGKSVDLDALLRFESRIDTLAMLAFDIYMKCREDICQIRVNEVQKRNSRLLERAKIICELPDHGEEPD